VFDGVKQCRNACTFCFMRMLPSGLRPSLYLRDDDFRLSFLVGTFVTLTNMTPEDEARIIEQRISPLRVSLQASNTAVRKRLLGKHAQHGLEALDRLLDAGIEFHAQIVLVPDENDGDVLRETLEWAYERQGILSVGIVPLGYTRYQDAFDHSFNDSGASQELLDLVKPFQERAEMERGQAWVYAADEFYRNAFGARLLENVPPASHYGDFSMFEDGIGIIRSTMDDWQRVANEGAIERFATALSARDLHAVMVVGCAQREFLDPLIDEAGIGDIFEPLYVENAFFGGNVDVTGLLVGADISQAVNDRSSTTDEAQHPGLMFLVPRVVFNDDGLTLDGMSLEDMEKATGQPLHVVSCSPLQYFDEITQLANEM
jgi:putative radical SAM enzyme (TIGR03279 family)